MQVLQGMQLHLWHFGNIQKTAGNTDGCRSPGTPETYKERNININKS